MDLSSPIAFTGRGEPCVVSPTPAGERGFRRSKTKPTKRSRRPNAKTSFVEAEASCDTSNESSEGDEGLDDGEEFIDDSSESDVSLEQAFCNGCGNYNIIQRVEGLRVCEGCGSDDIAGLPGSSSTLDYREQLAEELESQRAVDEQAALWALESWQPADGLPYVVAAADTLRSIAIDLKAEHKASANLSSDGELDVELALRDLVDCIKAGSFFENIPGALCRIDDLMASAVWAERVRALNWDEVNDFEEELAAEEVHRSEVVSDGEASDLEQLPPHNLWEQYVNPKNTAYKSGNYRCRGTRIFGTVSAVQHGDLSVFQVAEHTVKAIEYSRTGARRTHKGNAIHVCSFLCCEELHRLPSDESRPLHYHICVNIHTDNQERMDVEARNFSLRGEKSSCVYPMHFRTVESDTHWQNLRKYVMKDGHVFMKLGGEDTMPDGEKPWDSKANKWDVVLRDGLKEGLGKAALYELVMGDHDLGIRDKVIYHNQISQYISLMAPAEQKRLQADRLPTRMAEAPRVPQWER